MANTALTDLISLLQASNSNSEPVIQGKGPVLQQTGSGVINVPQQVQQKQKTPLEQAGDAIKVAKAYQDLQNTNSNSLSNIRFNAPEPDISSYLSDAFANSNFGEQAPIFTGSADGALAMNAPQFNSDINYSNGFNYEPVASTPDTPEDTQVITQQATPEQNNPAQDNSNTIMSASGIPLPSNESLEKEYQNNTVTTPMTGSGNSDAEANADLLAKRYASDYQNKKAASVLKEKQESRDYLMTHGIDEQGKYFELDSQGNRKYPWQPGTIRRGLEKVKKATAALGVATALTSPTVASAANPQDTGSAQTEQQGALQGAVSDAGKAVITQQQQVKDDNGALKKVGSTKPTDDATGTIFEGSQPEFDAIKAMANGIKTRQSGATLAELNELKSSIENIGNYAIDSFSTRNSMFGGGDNIAYAYKNAGANSAVVAKHVAESMNLDPKETISVKTMIDELQAKHPTLPASAIGMVLSQNLISEEEEQFWRPETNRGNISYLDSINGVLDDLANPNSKNNYASMKRDYARFGNFFNEIDSLNTKFALAADAINKQIQLYNIYKGKPQGKYAKETVDEANQDAYNYSADLTESALKIFNKIYANSKE